MADRKDNTRLYTLLGVEKTATQEEVKAAFQRKAQEYHPFVGGDPKTFEEI